MEPKVSLIMPVYNAAAFVADGIESIRRQTLEDFECICVDNGSEDASADACLESFQGDSRFRLIRQKRQECSCAAEARNAGLDAASGEYVQFIDSDDLLVPDALERTVSFIERAGLDMAAFNARVENLGVNMMQYIHAQKYVFRKRRYGILSGKDFITQTIADRKFNCYVFLQMIRRGRIRHRFPVIKLDEDLVYTIQNVSLLNRVGHLAEPVYVKRLMADSVLYGRMTFDKTISLMRAAELIENWVDAEDIQSKLGRVYIDGLVHLLGSLRIEASARWKRLDDFEKAKFQALPFSRKMQFGRFAKNEPHSP